MEEEVKKEIAELVDELVAKGGPTTGQIKANQDPDKVARLVELGWRPEEKGVTVESRLKKTEDLLELLAERTERICDTLTAHEKRITACSIRR